MIPVRAVPSGPMKGRRTIAELTPEAPASFGGVIVGGDKRGRLLGFPTANIATSDGQGIPADGVYACRVSFPPSTQRHGATVSIGNNPTFDDVTDRRIEAFVHDFDADLYGRSILVWVVGHLRNMVRFDTLEELIRFTTEDVHRSRTMLSTPLADAADS